MISRAAAEAQNPFGSPEPRDRGPAGTGSTLAADPALQVLGLSGLLCQLCVCCAEQRGAQLARDVASGG